MPPVTPGLKKSPTGLVATFQFLCMALAIDGQGLSNGYCQSNVVFAIHFAVKAAAGLTSCALLAARQRDGGA